MSKILSEACAFINHILCCFGKDRGDVAQLPLGRENYFEIIAPKKNMVNAYVISDIVLSGAEMFEIVLCSCSPFLLAWSVPLLVMTSLRSERLYSLDCVSESLISIMNSTTFLIYYRPKPVFVPAYLMRNFSLHTSKRCGVKV